MAFRIFPFFILTRIGSTFSYVTHRNSVPFMIRSRSSTLSSAADEMDWKTGLENLLGSRRTVDLDGSVASHQKHASMFLKTYRLAESVDRRRAIILHLISRYGQSNISSVGSSSSDSDEKWLAGKITLLKEVPPVYQRLFRAVGHLENGIKFLVDLRADVLLWLSESAQTMTSPSTSSDSQALDYTAALKLMDFVLRDLLSIWFSIGLLYVERVTWTSPCDILQRVAEYESVHPMRSWTDLKSRVGPRRRCFVFLHPSMPREPLIVLHVALMDRIPEKVTEVISVQRMNESNTAVFEEDLDGVNAAIFYSINSTQPGLKGIDLGHFMIKRIVQQLTAELPSITAFSTLSPIPNFRKWLMDELTRRLKGTASQLPLEHSEVTMLLDSLSDRNHWFSDESIRRTLQPILVRACAHYLLRVKHRGYAYDPVANFHLRNGAVLWRLNWEADTSAKGLNQSCSLMVNYRYYPSKTEENSRLYSEEKQIKVHDRVIALLQNAVVHSGL